MASIARYLSGRHPKPVLCDPNYPIEVGDLLFREPTNNLARPASRAGQPGQPDPQPAAFHNQFLGVALQKNGVQPNEVVPLNSTISHSPPNVIEVATTGMFEYQLAAATAFNGGEFVGPANDSGSTALQNQVVRR